MTGSEFKKSPGLQFLDPSISKTASGNLKASSKVIDKYLVLVADPDSTCLSPSGIETKSNSLE